jgi:hypothetical protein
MMPKNRKNVKRIKGKEMKKREEYDMIPPQRRFKRQAG